MTSTLTHKGYVAQLTIDTEAGVIHGQVVNTRDVLTFSAKAVSDLKAEFEETIADYEEWCASRGEAPQKPLSGTITLRMGAELHQAVSNRAALMRVSLNAWIVEALECAVGRKPATITSLELDDRIQTRARDEIVRVLDRRTTLGSDPEPREWARSEPRTIQ